MARLGIQVWLIAGAALALGLFAACGGEERAVKGDAMPVTFTIATVDNDFEPSAFEVEPTQSVTFNITNNGASTHNMVIGEHEHELARSEPFAIAAGQTGALVFTAPGDRGELDFHCDFHPDEMTGTIKVK